MHPILVSLRPGPVATQLGLLAAVLALSAFIVWDGQKKLVSAAIQAALFLAVGLFAVLRLATPERLPDPLVIDIRSWGVFTVLGMVSCFLIQRRLGARLGASGEQIFSLWFYGGVGAMIGARGLHVAVNWADYAAAPARALFVWDGGMVYLGGALGSLLAAGLWMRRNGFGLALLDAVVLGIALTQGIGRLGCFLAGCCYGQVTESPLGVRFPLGSIAHYTLAAGGVIPAEALHTPPLHPTQLYEAAATTALGLLLWSWYRRGPRPGLVVTGYFMGYSAVRFLLELLRFDPERQFLLRIPQDVPLLLSTSQAAGLVLIAAGALVLRRLHRDPGSGATPGSAGEAGGAPASPPG